MKKVLLKALVLMGLALGLHSISHAQTPLTLTGTLFNGASTCAANQCFTRFRLRNFQGNVPIVNGNTGIIAMTQVDAQTNSSGVYSTPLWGNDLIQPNTCGLSGNQACTFYTVEFWANGKMSSSENCTFTGVGTINLNTFTCIQGALPPNPVTGLGIAAAPLTSVQFNCNNLLCGSSNLEWNNSSNTLTLTGAMITTGTGIFNNTGTFGSSGWNNYLTSQVGPNSAQTISSLPGGPIAGFTDALEGIITSPVNANGATFANGLAGYALNLSGNTFTGGAGPVAVFGNAVCESNNSHCWGGNFVASGVTGFTGLTIYGTELDVNVLNASTQGAGLIINGSFLAQPSTLMPAINIKRPNAGATIGVWTPNAISVDNGASTSGIAIVVGTAAVSGCPACSPNNQPGASYGSQGVDSGGVQHIATWQADITGDFQIVPASGAGFIIGPSGTLLVSVITPTISSGFGTNPSVSLFNSSLAFMVNVGTGGTANTGVIAMNTNAANGWVCSVNDINAALSNVAYNTVQTGSTVNTITVQNQTKSTGAAVAWGVSDNLRLQCTGF